MILLPDITITKNIPISKDPLLQTTVEKISLLLREGDEISLLVRAVSYLLQPVIEKKLLQPGMLHPEEVLHHPATGGWIRVHRGEEMFLHPPRPEETLHLRPGTGE